MSEIRILIIDKDPATTNFIRLEFKKLGIEVLTENSLKEGLVLVYQFRPHVIILDPGSYKESLIEFIEKIQRDFRIKNCKLIAFSSKKSPDFIQSTLTLGFETYITKESGTVPYLIRSALQSAESVINEQRSPVGKFSPRTPKGDENLELLGKTGKTIIFLSAKGGLGTSSLCCNIAHITNVKMDYKISVVDLVLPIGSISTIVGVTDSFDIVQASLLEKSEELIPSLSKKMIRPENWNFKFLAGSNSPSNSEEIDITQIFLIINALKKMSDYVFVDIGKSLSKISLPIIKSADQIVLTLGVDQTTVEHTKTVWNYLKKQGVEHNQIYFLINRAVGLEGLSKSDVEEILDTGIQLAIPYMGSNFTLSNNLHQPITDKFPQDAVSISLRQASDDILKRIETRTSKLEFF